MQAHRTIKRSVAWGILAFLISVAGGLIATRNAEQFQVAILLMVVSLAICVATLTMVCISKETRPVAFTSLIYLILYYIGPGLIHLRIERFPFFGMSYSSDVANKASLIILIFCSLFAIFVISATTYGVHARPADRSQLKSANIPRAGIVVLLAVVALLAGNAIGFGTLFLNRGDLGRAMGEQSPAELILIQIARSSAFFAFLLAVFIARRKKELPGYLLAFATLLIFVALNNPLSLPRYMVGAYILIGAFTFSSLGRVAKVCATVIAATAQVTIFPLLSDISRGGGLGAYVFDPFGYISRHGDFDGFQSTLNVVELVNGEGLMLGRQIGSALLFWVPRSIFPNKSIGTGGDAATYVGYPFINISSPLPAEFYVDFGLIGLTILTSAFALLVNKLDSAYEAASARADIFKRIIVAAVAGYAFIILRGSLVGVLGPVVFSVTLLLLLRLLNKVQIKLR